MRPGRPGQAGRLRAAPGRRLDQPLREGPDTGCAALATRDRLAARKMPADHPRPGIVHNDYRFDNVILDADNPMRIIGVLDWEMATLGDPLMDLGNSLAYWIEAGDPAPVQLMRRQPSNAPGMLSRRQFVDYYAERAGIRLENFDFYYCYGLFRLAGIVQQIYYRYYHGQTQDKRFAQFIHMNRLLEQMTLQVIAKSSL
ncbi:phosphotransferase [Pseudomonas juntendi]|nr:phosphotransferase [Pseudomonas juntendi]